jgi:2-polyprenyl-3-methyl-5-hydroxy-6-metoxy-1,4-benzoquinol methylase
VSVGPVPASWPKQGLEVLGICPLCGGNKRNVLHRDLEDRVFKVAPGAWTLYRCDECALAYLDPRPDVGSIALAYSSYYTHVKQPDDDPSAPGDGFAARWKQRVLRDYLSTHHGSGRTPWHGLLARAMWLRPRVKRSFDLSMRGLPRPWPGAQVLDIGCGSGRFLAWARWAGWRCIGTDVDPLAVSQAREQGLDVLHCDVRDVGEIGRTFDAITISHVIEHVHEPRRLLQDARRLLKPGGYFWIETPNIDSWGHQVFGRHWRGLEPPRHLQLFHPALLRQLVEQAGFVSVANAPWRADWDAIYPASMALAREGGAERDIHPGPQPERIGRDDPDRREFITIVATANG